MIGVILWSDPTQQKAVIWCEDQGDLAYLSDHCANDPLEAFFDVGEMVEFEVQTTCDMRIAIHARRLHQNWGTALTDTLRRLGPEAEASYMACPSAQVIPFRPIRPMPNPYDQASRQKRRG